MPVASPRCLFAQATSLAFVVAFITHRAVLAENLAADSAAIVPSFAPDGRSAAAARTADSTSKTPIQVYRTACLRCHDTDGKGEIVRDVFPQVPDFTNEKWHASRSDANLKRSILEGKGKSMPCMKDKLGATDVTQIVAFVRAFRGGKQVVDEEPEAQTAPEQPRPDAIATAATPHPAGPPSPAPKDERRQQASRLFQRFCATCHAADGKGTDMRDSLPRIPDFTKSAWQDDRTDPQLLVSILGGKGTEMPAFRGKIAREQVRDLIAFIRAFAPSKSRPAGTDADDFEARFKELNDEFENLRRLSRALSPAPPSQTSSSPAPPLSETGSRP